MKYWLLLAAVALGCGTADAASLKGDVKTSPSAYGSFKMRVDNPVKPMRITKVKDALTLSKAPHKTIGYTGDGLDEINKMGECKLLMEEDFSLLTTGSEEEPDLKTELGYNITDPEYDNVWFNMRPQYYHGDKPWGVGRGYSAGGKLYFPFTYNDNQARVVLPLMDLSDNQGTFVVEFKAKLSAAPSEGAIAQPAILIEAAETNGWSSLWDVIDESFYCSNLSTDWQTYRIVFIGGGPTSFVNMVGMGVENGMFLDDIKVYTLKPHVERPEIVRHTNFTNDSFTVNWLPAKGAESYVVNVWGFDVFGAKYFLAENKETSETSLSVSGADPYDTYFMTVEAQGSGHKSFTSATYEIFDIVAPKMRAAEKLDDNGCHYKGGVEEVPSAYGYNYTATAKRVAEADGKFYVTREDFTDWVLPMYDDEYTRENPFDQLLGGPYFPETIKQQGWYGENFNTYKDYLCLVPFMYEASMPHEMSSWVSPEFDLSKDGGNVSVSLDGCADLWEFDGDDGNHYSYYGKVVVALFNYDEAIHDYTQVDAVYVQLGQDWKKYTAELKGATDRSKVAFFAMGSYNDIYLDNIDIWQNYKAGEWFLDPFYFSTWQLAEVMDDPTVFDVNVPKHAQGHDIYQNAEAVRAKFENGEYTGIYATSPAAGADYMGESITGVSYINNSLTSSVKVAGNKIVISNPEGRKVSVATADGKQIRLGNAGQLVYSPAKGGVYIVSVGDKSIKVAF